VQRDLTSKRPLHLCLEDWIEDEVFGSTKREGWFNAVAYYATRDLRYQKAEVCWSECVKKWKESNLFATPLSTSGKVWRDGEIVQPTFRRGNANCGRLRRASILTDWPIQSRVISIGKPLLTGLDQHWKVQLNCPAKSRLN
jgi:hypothetical protein